MFVHGCSESELLEDEVSGESERDRFVLLEDRCFEKLLKPVPDDLL